MRRLGRPLRRLRPDAFRNTVAGARRNIAAHYDLGNDLFELFLDRDPMVYSCALFERADDALEEAQRAKVDRVCRALELGPTRTCSRSAAAGAASPCTRRDYGCRVTTTTISAEQRAYAEARIQRAGLDDRVRVIGQDYRELEGRFDRLASIEMIEAVGWQYLDLFFERCSELLAPDGLIFLQAICTDDRAYEAEKDAPSFSNRLIFPGGCLPSVEAIARSLAARTDMRTVWLEDISASYVLTLRALAGALPRRRAAARGARLRPALPAALGALPGHLGGRLCRGAHHGRPDAVRQARLALAGRRGPRRSRGRPARLTWSPGCASASWPAGRT